MSPITQYGEPARVHVAFTMVPGGTTVPHVPAHSGAHPEPCPAAIRAEPTMASMETTVESVFLAVMIPPLAGLDGVALRLIRST